MTSNTVTIDDRGTLHVSGFAFMSEWSMVVTLSDPPIELEAGRGIDWESVRDTPEAVIEYAKEWHDLDWELGQVVRVTATVERVATLVECEEPEQVEIEPEELLPLFDA